MHRGLDIDDYTLYPLCIIKQFLYTINIIGAPIKCSKPIYKNISKHKNI